MTPDELQGGFQRLAVITIVLVLCALIASTIFALAGARGRAALAAGNGTVGIILLFGGVAAFARASPLRQLRAHPDEAEVRRVERRETEHLALGLFAYGLAFSAISLVLE